MPAGLVIATDQTMARAYADDPDRAHRARHPCVVLSDEKASSERIAAFAEGDERWMVAVRMVSEGVDVPRLSVGVYATSASTPLFFAQAIGRFVRARRRGELASIFVPSVPSLLGLATELERERDHALDRESPDDELLDDDAARARRAAGVGIGRPARRVRVDGARLGRDLREGALRRRGVRHARRAGQRRGVGLHRPARDPRARGGVAAAALAPGASAPARRGAAARAGGRLRARRRCTAPCPSSASCSTAWCRSTRGQPGTTHAQVHAEVRRLCGGPEVARATVTQLQARIDLLRRRIGGR